MTASGRPIGRILAIRRKALGDALVTLPAIRQLAAAFPDADLDLVIDRPFAPLLRHLAPGVNVLAWPPPERPRRWPWRVREAGYDLVLDFLGSPRTALWTVISGAPLRVGYDLPRRRWAYNLRVPRHRLGPHRLTQFAGEAFLDPLRRLGLAPAPWRAVATAPPAAPDSAQLTAGYLRWDAAWPRGDRPRAALMVSATWPAKSWPAAQVAELQRLLDAAGLETVLVPGPGDGELLAALRRAAPQARYAPPTSLLDLAHLLGRCDVFVGTDCGPRHLAAVLGLPTVTLFGPTDARGWNPDDPRHVAVMRPVPCAPCNLLRCPVPGHPCLDALPARRVADAVLDLLARHGPTGRSR